MQRRTALGIFGAAIVSPFAQLKTGPPELDLKQFCSEYEAGGYKLNLPFLQRGTVYATDGRILVGVPEATCEIGDADARIPDLSQLPLDDQGRWYPMPAGLSSDPKSRGCPYCWFKGRTGPGVRFCEECDQGLVYADDGGWQRPCDVCKGTEYVGGHECEYCDGRGETDRPSVMRFGPLTMSGHYALRFASLPGVMWTPARVTTLGHNPSELRAIKFRFDGQGRGLGMLIEKD